MKTIDHLPPEEQQHYILCDCGHYVNMRDLGEVFRHEHKGLPMPEWSHSVRKGDPAAFTRKGRRIGLN